MNTKRDTLSLIADDYLGQPLDPQVGDFLGYAIGSDNYRVQVAARTPKTVKVSSALFGLILTFRWNERKQRWLGKGGIGCLNRDARTELDPSF